MNLITKFTPFSKEFEIEGENLEEQLLHAATKRHAAALCQVIVPAMRKFPKLTLSGFEQFFRTQEELPASAIFLLSAPMSNVNLPRVKALDIRSDADLPRYLWFSVNGPLEAMDFMAAFGIQDNVHNMKLLDFETGVLTQAPENNTVITWRPGHLPG